LNPQPETDEWELPKRLADISTDFFRTFRSNHANINNQ
jgi:hypothetical protein